MIVQFGDFTVEVKAKGVLDEKKFNKEDLELFLAGLRLTCLDAMNFATGNGNYESVEEYKKCEEAISRALEEIRS